MNILIDTHIFLWWLKNPEKLKAKELKQIENPNNFIYVSAVTTWEIVIKCALKKLTFQGSLSNAIVDNNFQELAISVEHTKQLAKLPAIHSDPFDRLLIAQAISEKYNLMTHDKRILKYKVR